MLAAPAARRTAFHPAGRTAAPDSGAAEDPPPRGCAWYDSSYELQRGLRVTEHAEVDAVAPLLPLSWWLAWELDAALPSVR